MELVAAVVWPGAISTFFGVKEQVIVSGRFEQESVINTDSAKLDVYDARGTMETVTFPDSPGESVFTGVVAGVIFETAGMKLHPAGILTARASEDELSYVESPAKFAVRI
jgi:hypothetical protein